VADAAPRRGLADRGRRPAEIRGQRVRTIPPGSFTKPAWTSPGRTSACGLRVGRSGLPFGVVCRPPRTTADRRPILVAVELRNCQEVTGPSRCTAVAGEVRESAPASEAARPSPPFHRAEQARRPVPTRRPELPVHRGLISRCLPRSLISAGWYGPRTPPDCEASAVSEGACTSGGAAVPEDGCLEGFCPARLPSGNPIRCAQLQSPLGWTSSADAAGAKSTCSKCRGRQRQVLVAVGFSVAAFSSTHKVGRSWRRTESNDIAACRRPGLRHDNVVGSPGLIAAAATWVL
jgi:hypothetical protein